MRYSIILLAIAVGACGSSSTSPSTTTTSYGSFTITADATVSDSDQALVHDEMQNVALPYFATNFGWQPSTPVHVTMAAGGAAFNGELGSAGRNSFTIYVYPNWSITSDETKRTTVVHELFHVLQTAVGWNLSRTAAWMNEGSAIYASYRAALIDNGLFSAAQVHACKKNLVIPYPTVPPLSQLERSLFYTLAEGSQFIPVYTDAYLAVDHLMQSVPLRTLPNVGVPTTPFADAFQATFGEPLADFYSDFDNYRASWQTVPEPYDCAF